MSDDIINFYKNASDTEETVKEEVISEEIEPVEVKSEPVEISEDDPLQAVFQTLVENLQKTKASEFNKPKEEIIEEGNEEPFAKFLGNVANIIKEDSKLQTDEQIKEATIGFINKIKDEDLKPVEEKKRRSSYVPAKLLKNYPKKRGSKIPIVEPKEEIKEEPVVEEVEEVPVIRNAYVKELKTKDDKTRKVHTPGKPTDLKTLVEKKVREEIDKFSQHFAQISMTAGGGGSVAVQYADGGTMRGNLNVTGKYLSGGRDLATIFGGGGGGGTPTNKLSANGYTLTLNNDGSVTFPDNIIRSEYDAPITLVSESLNDTYYSGIALSPYAFYAYDNAVNNIYFNSTDNNIIIETVSAYPWTFGHNGVFTGPNNIFTVGGTISALGPILSGGKNILDIFTSSEAYVLVGNTIKSRYGNHNASGKYNTVAGGLNNTVSGCYSSIGGGCNNTVSNHYSFIGSGRGNNIYDQFAVITGGINNTSCNLGSTVGGGSSNTSSGRYSVIAGGYNNCALALRSNVGGGSCNVASGECSTVSGGYYNCSLDVGATVAGGSENKATAYVSFVGGGRTNTASGAYSTVGGGYSNTASNCYSTIGGGASNYNTGECSFIGGGNSNIAALFNSVVVGGQNNSACGNGAAIVGGFCHFSCGFASFIGGGGNPYTTIGNAVSGDYSAIVGGQANKIFTNNSFIGGGNSNTASGNYSFIGGGVSNEANNSAIAATIVGGQGNIISGGYATFIGGGEGNHNTSSHGVIAGGCNNSVSGDYSAIVGGENNCITPIQGDHNFIGGGVQNTVSGYKNSIVGGQGNTVSTYTDYSTIVSGINNKTCSGYNIFVKESIITHGSNNCICPATNDCNEAPATITRSILGGSCNIITTCAYYDYDNLVSGCASICNSSILNGIQNRICGTASSTYSSQQGFQVGAPAIIISSLIVSGSANKIVNDQTIGSQQPTNFSTILNGSNNLICTDISYTSILGGRNNTTVSGNYSTIIGGYNNISNSSCSFIAGGCNNKTNTNKNTFILGSNISAPLANYTYVNNLSSQGLVNTLTVSTSSLRVGNSTAVVTALSASRTSRRIQIFDQSGASLGYIPVYATI